jgi:hypothetical protein
MTALGALFWSAHLVSSVFTAFLGHWICLSVELGAKEVVLGGVLLGRTHEGKGLSPGCLFIFFREAQAGLLPIRPPSASHVGAQDEPCRVTAFT